MDSIGMAAWYYLDGLDDVTGLLGSFSSSDPNLSNAGKPWLFSDPNMDVLAFVQGSSSCAMVLSGFGSWSGAEAFSTVQYPRLRVDYWVDPLRDGGGNITESAVYTEQRGLQLAERAHRYLQRTDPDTQIWGDIATISCQGLTFPPQFTAITPAPGGGDWLQRGTAYYGLTVAGWTDVNV
jgi:hypothetical protein